MKKYFSLLIFLLVVVTALRSVSQEPGNLCVGHYYTEAEARDVLHDLKLQYPTENDWL